MFETAEGGPFLLEIWGSYYYNGSQYFLNSGGGNAAYQQPVNLGQSFPTIDTVGNVNVPPVVTLLGPEGESLHRQGAPEFFQGFTIRGRDGDGHNWTGEVQVECPSGALDPRCGADGGRLFTDDFSGLKQRHNAEATTVPVQMPHENGTYTWRARAKDTSGTSTAQGAWVEGSFDYVWNLAPEVPELVAPLSGSQAGPNPTFVIETDDPELDSYTGVIQYWNVERPFDKTEVLTAPAASGSPAAAQAVEVLEPGETYAWHARAVDGADPSLRSDFSPVRTFSVVGAGSNAPPGAPSLVSPVDGFEFGAGDDQGFTITATDPDGDGYVGVVSVFDAAGDETVVVTELAESGAPSSGEPFETFGPGAYSWSARAVDSRGGAGPSSPLQGFSVAGPPPPPPNDPPSASLVSPSDGHVFGSNDDQVFTVSATDPQGDGWRGEVEVDGEVVCETPEAASGGNASCAPAMPAGAGEHSWRARAIDDRGAAGAWTSTRAFTVVDGSPPGVPAAVSPSDGHTFGSADPQLFAVNSVDADGDPYHAEVTVRDGATVVRTFETAEAPSGFDSYGGPVPPLPPGSYTWSAVAVDVDGNRSEASDDLDVVVNSPPETPALVGPAAGKTFLPGEPQVFTITAVDADGHDYQGTVTVENAATGVPVARFDTTRVPSGAQAAGSPLVRLPAGAYRWSATASDPYGGTSPPSVKRAFTVT